jgi:hypothetical protein
MPSADSQHTEKRELKRRYHGDLWAGLIVRYLNSEPFAKDVSSVRIIIDCCRRIVELAQQANLTSDEWLTRGVEPPQTAELIEIAELERDLRRFLEEFRSIPVIRLSGNSKEGQAPPLHAYWELSPDSPFAERDNQRGWPLLDALLSAIEDGSLTKVLPCICGTYFFQKFSHQKFCSEKCRVKWNLSSENSREYRRRKQRDYYHLHKSGKVK